MTDTITISITKTIDLDALTSRIIDEISEWVCDRYDIDDAADIPSLNTSKLTAGTLGIARGGTGVTAATGSAMQPVYLSSSGLAACRAPSSLYSGTLSSGSTTLTNAFNYNAIIVMGLPGTSTYTTKATVTIPTALITTTASRWGIANESYGVAFTLTKSGSNITLAWAAGTGSITNFYGVI